MPTVSDHAHTILEYIAAHPRSAETDILSALQKTYDLTLSRHLLCTCQAPGFCPHPLAAISSPQREPKPYSRRAMMPPAAPMRKQSVRRIALLRLFFR